MKTNNNLKHTQILTIRVSRVNEIVINLQINLQIEQKYRIENNTGQK